MNDHPVLIEVKHLKKVFRKGSQQDMLVLNDITLEVHQGEIVVLVGRSGSGKTTLLRTIAGLTAPSSGEVLYRHHLIRQPMKGIAMVFQSFALLPWLTVLQNTELGLEALGVARAERRRRALQAIDRIGLDGFESAFPRELSGGMRQRVGIARALVVDPSVLLMDEPFASLDVLTADNLRNDFIDLWQKEGIHQRGILLVTHNMEEAVSLADRVIVFTETPSVIGGELRIPLAHPRDSQSPEFRRFVDRIYAMMTANAPTAAPSKVIDLGYRLPNANVFELAGLLETIEELGTANEPIPLVRIVDELSLDIDELLSLTQVLGILHLASESEGAIQLTAEGQAFVSGDMHYRKKVFAKQLLDSIPLARHIYTVLNASPSHRVHRHRFVGDLSAYLSDHDAHRVLQVITEWGRYAELFAYNDKTEEMNLEDPG